jgi:hypothetical protein
LKKQEVKSPEFGPPRQNITGILFFLFYLLASQNCSQIWLSPFLDDCLSTYFKKLGKKIRKKDSLLPNFSVSFLGEFFAHWPILKNEPC